MKGKVCGVSERENIWDGKKEKCASLDLEGYEIKIAPKNIWTDMADEDD